MFDLIFFMMEKYYRGRVNIRDFKFGQTRSPNLALQLSNYVTLGKFLDFSETSL